MPTLPSFLKPKPPPPPPLTTYYLPTSSSNSPALAPLPNPPPIRQIPLETLILGLTHPEPTRSPATAFFLTCIPDPPGLMWHMSKVIRGILDPSQSFPRPGVRGFPDDPSPPAAPRPWRFQLLHLRLSPEPGLAYTSSGTLTLSLQWLDTLRTQVLDSKMRDVDATREIKGVIIHELTHAIQRDGFGSTPGWLVESIADYVRLQSGLGARHWKRPGEGGKWEEGYDTGARFLGWLEGVEAVEPDRSGGRDAGLTEELANLSISSKNPPRETASIPQSIPAPGPPRSTAAPPAPTQYPAYPPPPGPPPIASPTKPRLGPFPHLVHRFNVRLEHERWSDSWWDEMCGAGLQRLWDDYKGYYR